MQELSSNSTEKKQAKQIFRNLFYLADVSGTGYWRRILPITIANTLQSATGIYNTYTMDFIPDPRFYMGLNSVTVQRWTGKQHRELFEKFLYPITRKTGTCLVYEIDDAMLGDDIPLYNRGRASFTDKEVQANIKYMLNASDVVTVTTPYIKGYYNRKYGVPLEKLIAVPNLLSRMWIGDRFDPQRKLEQFNQNKAKPRIGIISSLSHYNIQKVKDSEGNLVKDDLDEIKQVILDTLDDFQWVIIGFVPDDMKKLVEEKKIQCYRMVPITAYPALLEHIQLQAVVAPIQKNEFNRCKSPIKFLECCALGVPLFATDSVPYSGVMPNDFLFNTPEELKDKLMKLKFGSAGVYKKIIETNWNWLNTPRTDGDFKITNSWMEDNIGMWLSIFSMERRSEQPKKDEEKNNG